MLPQDGVQQIIRVSVHYPPWKMMAALLFDNYYFVKDYLSRNAPSSQRPTKPIKKFGYYSRRSSRDIHRPQKHTYKEFNFSVFCYVVTGAVRDHLKNGTLSYPRAILCYGMTLAHSSNAAPQ